MSKIAIISVPKVRECVNTLLWWEEEVTRLRLLGELRNAIVESAGLEGEKGAGSHELDMALRAVRARREVLPSRRLRDGTLMGEGSLGEEGLGDEEAVPAYE